MAAVTLSAQKADRIVRDFTSFDHEGNTMLKLLSQLHTSRVSAFGFTAEADVLGVETYAISEQLDIHICPVCRAMHGRTFTVVAARRLLDQVLFEDNPEVIKSLQPWPSQKAANVAAMRSMTDQELIDKGWHIPPFHPWCRGLLVHVDTVPELVNDPPPEGEVDRRTRFGRKVTREDFDALEADNPELVLEYGGDSHKVVLAWNELFGDLNPMALYNSLDNGLKGMPSEFGSRLKLTGNKLTEKRGWFQYSFNVPDADGIEAVAMDRIFQLRDNVLVADHEYFKIAPNLTGKGLGKSYMGNAVALYQDMGVDKIKLHANINVGSYAWARYGFAPGSSAKAIHLQKQLLERMDFWKRMGTGPQLLADIDEAVTTLIQNLDDTHSNLRLIADLGQLIQGKTLGYWLLEDLDWYGELALDNSEQMSTFLSYVGGLL